MAEKALSGSTLVYHLQKNQEQEEQEEQERNRRNRRNRMSRISRMNVKRILSIYLKITIFVQIIL